MEQHNARPSDARACILSALLTPAIKEAHYLHGSLGALRSQGSSRIAYARQIEIVTRPATLFQPYVSHTYLSENDCSTRPHTSLNEAHPDGVRKPPDEAMTILELLSLHLSVGGLVKAIACDQRFQKALSPNARKT
jgi:hypothetical protein